MRVHCSMHLNPDRRLGQQKREEKGDGRKDARKEKQREEEKAEGGKKR